MTTKTTTATKTNTKATKATKPKAEAKTTTKAAVKPYADILKTALEGKFGPLVQRFYASALGYHSKKGTSFPRAQTANHALLAPADAITALEKHSKTSIPAGAGWSQKLFDQMVVEAFGGKVPAKQ